MKQPSLVLLGFLAVVVSVFGQAPADPPLNHLVQCGSEAVATFDDTLSKDGRLVVGWTIRSKGKKPPAPWVDYDQDKPAVVANMHLLQNEDGTPRNGDCYAVDGLVDLKTKQFLELPSEDVAYQGRARGGFEAAWSGDKGGTRYGVLLNNHTGSHAIFTADLWLVEMRADGPHLTNLKPAAEGAIRGFLRKRDPKDAAQYQWQCNVDEITERGQGKYHVFKGGTLTLPFEANVIDKPSDADAGFLSFALPAGTVQGVAPDEAGRRELLR